jgi:hypothetical protein
LLYERGVAACFADRVPEARDELSGGDAELRKYFLGWCSAVGCPDVGEADQFFGLVPGADSAGL